MVQKNKQKLSQANARRESLLKQYNEQREATFEIMQSKNRTDEAGEPSSFYCTRYSVSASVSVYSISI